MSSLTCLKKNWRKTGDTVADITKTSKLFYCNLQRLMAEHNVRYTHIERAMGIQGGRLRQMEKRHTFPQGRTVDKLVEFFDVTHAEFFANLGYIDEEE